MSRHLRTACLAALLAVVLAGMVAGFASGSGSNVQTVHVQTVHVLSGRPHITTIDLGRSGKSPGDLYPLDARVLSANGRRVIGELVGTQTDIKHEHRAETVQGLLTFKFETGNEIVVGGVSAFPRSGTGLIRGKSYVRAVLGGIGRYAGAKGTLTSTRLASGRYDQVFRLTY